MSSQAHPSKVPRRNLNQVQGKLVRDSKSSLATGLTREMKAGDLAIPPSRKRRKDRPADIERLSRTTITTNKVIDRPLTYDNCRTRTHIPAYVENAKAYEGTDYTRVLREAEIIAASHTMNISRTIN
ncbi:hypothetical protein BLNAU_24608 [Blattamonas nauphoetae]|uniref:Uncharacterized protein n=1 Tax=Blattamonas nauphoetae TaxID=2049346 RepID=A0ABQ9WLZ3_9EUKA|nr:hypothetical protein BLNAU_24608 [Blattamonas nauphoetae]